MNLRHWATLSTLQSDCRTLHVGLGVLRLDRDRLLVATRHQIQIGGERRSLGDDLKADAFDLTGQGAGGIAGGFAPGTGNCAGGVACAAAQIEIIAVARAVDIELKLVLPSNTS